MLSRIQQVFITGNQAVVLGAQAIGANCFCGYPITPTTEILEEWAKLSVASAKNPRNRPLFFLQAEDETSAGFNTLGAILAGAKAFTATAGPGHILMQDPLAMAEAMRLPMVVVVMQRGGPSTGTVIYGQQEVTLACFGGNGEGLRIVYSIANPQEAYDYTIKAFQTAWQYRFPTLVLGDGYVAKMKDKVKLSNQRKSALPSASIRLPIGNLRNCYNIEAELAKQLKKDLLDWQKISPKISQSETYNCRRAEIILVAHGIVSQAAKQAIEKCRTQNTECRIGLFRPITLRPFDYPTLSRLAAAARKMIILESSAGHFERLVKAGTYGLSKIESYQKPVEAISVEEIMRLIR